MTLTSAATSMLRDDQKIVKSLEGNNICADCEQTNPTWCSVSFGILLCLECSGKHRGLGTHISFVRSLDMDSFSAKQIQVLKVGGNKQCNSYLQDQHTQQQPQQQRENTTTDDFTTTACTNSTTKNNSARVKYDNNIAELYKLKLKARVEGNPEPTELPVGTTTQRTSSSSSSQQQGGSSQRPPSNRFVNSTPQPLFLYSIISAYKFLFVSSPSYYGTMILNNIRDDKPWLYRGGLALFGGLIGMASTKIATTYATVASTTTATTTPTARYYYGAQIISCGVIGIITFISLIYIPLSLAYAFQKKRLPAYKSSVNDYTQRCMNMRAKRNKGYEVFFPPNVTIGDSVEKALIFYPGILVDHMAYAMILGKLSDMGILVLLVNAEPNRVCSEIASIDHIKRLRFEISTLMDITVKEWILGGHSLGGIISSSLFMKDDVVVDDIHITRLVQWATPDSLNLRRDGSGLRSVLRVNGSCDGIIVPSDKGIIYSQSKVPKDCTLKVITIQNGNHSGFAHYGPQFFPNPDWERGITLDEQQTQIVQITSDYILEKLKPK